MAEETGVSVITIQHTYEILCEEGYVEARQRSGYFVIYKENDFISSSEIGEKSIRHVENTHRVKYVFPFTVLSKTMRRVLTEYGEEILVKSPNHGCMMLRQAIAAYLNRSSDILVKPEQIIIG